MNNSFVIKGNFCQAKNPGQLDLYEMAFAVCVDGLSKGVFKTLPEEYSHLPLYDYGDSLIFPGMIDLHVHAPQYAFRGMCMDLELMDWLNRYTFPEEEKYANLEYAEKTVYNQMSRFNAGLVPISEVLMNQTSLFEATENLIDKQIAYSKALTAYNGRKSK